MDATTIIGLLSLGLFVGSYGTIIGAGGGFIMIPALVLLFDLSGATAVGTGAVALMLVGLGGSMSYTRSGLVAWPVAGWFALGSVPLALLTAWLVANRIDADAFVGILGVLLLALAAFVVFGPSMPTDAAAELPPRPRALTLGGVLVGATSGTFAVGGGLLTVPMLSRLQRLRAHRATATTSATAMASSLAGSVGHAIAGNVVWEKTAYLCVGSIIGAIAGARLAGRLSADAVVTLVAIGLVAAGIPLLVDAF